MTVTSELLGVASLQIRVWSTKVSSIDMSLDLGKHITLELMTGDRRSKEAAATAMPLKAISKKSMRRRMFLKGIQDVL